MKLLFLILLSTGTLTLSAQIKIAENTVDLVNPLMGTDSKPSLSNGNTYPAVCVPWGMNFWTPQTGAMGNGWQYQYSADKIRGFKQTHQPSPWMNDYGQFSIMPVTGKMKFRQDDRASWFSHKSEIAKPYYYSVYLADANVTTEITTTERAAQFQFTFPESDSSFIVVDAFDRGSFIKIIPEQQKVIGYSTRYSRGKLINFKNYFEIRFDKAFTVSRVWHDSSLVRDSLETTALHAGAVIGFLTAKGEKIGVRIASSFISPAQAGISLDREIGMSTFEQTRSKAKTLWQQVFARVKAEGGTEEQRRTFYSCLYRAVQFPQKLYEIDASGKTIHWSPYNGKVLPGKMFGGTGFWDTFRALYPLLNLLYPSINAEMQEGLENAYREGGWLPEWSSPGLSDIMIGNNSASVVAEAYLKGTRGYNIDTLYSALLHGADLEGPMDAVGRRGASFYKDLGYVPYDVGINESAARSLEYCYDDFAIWRLAKKLNRPKNEIDYFATRALNYQKIFDPETKLMRGKNKDGSFMKPFNPFKWGDAFTEGNAWHYTWSVFHDIAGLKKLMGGDKVFTGMLDSVFNLPPLYDESYYRSVIHEIREMQIANMGQYAHGNQPIQHMAYLYNYAGEPWKTQMLVRDIMTRLYKPTPDGYCGDEDNGQTSAWYIFSAMGFYPVCPASDEYVLGSPLFERITLNFENGRQLLISATGNNASTLYVHELHFNGTLRNKNYLNHFDLQRGGKLDFTLRNFPDRLRGTATAASPYSFSTDTSK